mgnify:CR=1 FL=1
MRQTITPVNRKELYEAITFDNCGVRSFNQFTGEVRNGDLYVIITRWNDRKILVSYCKKNVDYAVNYSLHSSLNSLVNKVSKYLNLD